MIAWTMRGKEKQVILAGGKQKKKYKKKTTTTSKEWNSMELEIRFCRTWEEIRLQASGLTSYGTPFKGLILESIIWSEVKSLSRVWLFVTSWTVAYWTPPSMGFSRQEYWRGLPFPSPGELPDPGIKPRSPALRADALPSGPPGKSEEQGEPF